MATRSYRIDSALLIDEVRKRPLLYDAKQSVRSPESKKEAWDEIADALFGADVFAALSADEKEGLIKEMQVKWKSLRDNFTRVLRKEKADIMNGVPEEKRRRYVHFDRLMFLAPYCKGSRSSSSGNPNVIYLEENKDSNDSNSMFACATGSSEENNPLYSMDFYDIPEAHGGPGRSEEDQKKEVHEGTSAGSSGGTSGGIDTTSSARIARVLEEIVRLERDDKADDPMGNRKFLQSLLPFMKKLPDDVNLEVRLQIMGVLQTYLNNKILL